MRPVQLVAPLLALQYLHQTLVVVHAHRDPPHRNLLQREHLSRLQLGYELDHLQLSELVVVQLQLLQVGQVKCLNDVQAVPPECA